MDLATFGRIMFAQGLLFAIGWAIENLGGVQLPVPPWAAGWVYQALAAALNAAAAWVREQFGIENARRLKTLGQAPTPVPFYAKVF